MAKKTNQNIIVQNISFKAVNRTNIDIAKWRQALKNAEADSKTRYGLYDIYEEILLDGHLSSLIEKRINAITNLELKFFDKSGKENEDVNSLINTIWFEKLLKEIILAKFYGFSLIQILGLRNDEKPKVESVDRRYIKPEFGIVTKTGSEVIGVNYNDYPDVLFIEDSKYGILLKACVYVILNRNNISDWADFNEVFGKPYAQGTYQNDDSADILSKAFEAAKFESYLVAPNDAEIKLHTVNFSGSFPFQYFNDKMSEALSILILGQNLTTKVDGGSFAAAQTHGDVEQNINYADQTFVIKTLNEKFIPILQYYGYNIDGNFSFIYSDELPLEKRIEVDIKLANIIPIDNDYFYDTYNVPKPINEGKGQISNNNPQLKKLRKNRIWDFFAKRAVIKF
jgi:phage gp29-like protein